MTATLEEILRAAEIQAAWCKLAEAPFTAGVVEIIRDNLARGGALSPFMVPWPGNPMADALILRATGVLHLIVRTGRAPGLAAYYPGFGDKPWDVAAVGHEVDAAVAANTPLVRDILSGPPQTNETGRSAVLMPGYAEVAHRTGLPLSILEIGASAGLNLNWNRYAYRYANRFVGDANAPVIIEAEWRGPWAGLERLPEVVAKRGCDQAPIDLASPGAADRLAAYVWPEQKPRLARLEAAIALALRDKPQLEKADAADWLDRQLANQVAGAVTVVAHTIVWPYLAEETRARIDAMIRSAGARATKEAPIAWLSFEQFKMDELPELNLTLWPGGEKQKLANAHPHGAWIEWLG